MPIHDASNFYVKSRDLDLLKAYSLEITNDLSQQMVDIYKIDKSSSSYDSLYGEIADPEDDLIMTKYDNVYCFVGVMSTELVLEKYGVAHEQAIECYFDANYLSGRSLEIREGDVILWEDKIFDVRWARKSQRIFGLKDQRLSYHVEAVTTRDKIYNLEGAED
tara:strand:+ start:2786 stop:3274 length:489 start_codon:yes stop_codon:yes gene_type:complete